MEDLDKFCQSFHLPRIEILPMLKPERVAFLRIVAFFHQVSVRFLVNEAHVVSHEDFDEKLEVVYFLGEVCI